MSRLQLVVPERTGGLAPVALMPGLRSLAVHCGEALEQRAIDELGALPAVTTLALSVGPDVELDMLLQVGSLRRLQLGIGGREYAPRTVATVAKLVQRGVDIFLYPHEPWVGDVTTEALGAATIVRNRGGMALTSEPSRAERLRSQLAINSFWLG